MFAVKSVFEFMLIIYSISIIGYFIDFMKRNDRVNKVSFYLLCLVWFVQTIILYYVTIVKKIFPILTLHDGLFFYAWILILFSLLLNWFFRVHFIILFTNVISFLTLLLALMLNAMTSFDAQSVQFVHEILIIHIIFTIVSYGFFTLSFALSSMYLVQYYFLKRKKGFRWMWRFTDLHKLDELSFLFMIIGVPLLFIGIIFGVVWAYFAQAEFYWFDFKTIGSILVLMIYIVALLLRFFNGYRGRPTSVYNAIAFSALLINFFLFSSLSSFHF